MYLKVNIELELYYISFRYKQGWYEKQQTHMFHNVLIIWNKYVKENFNIIVPLPFLLARRSCWQQWLYWNLFVSPHWLPPQCYWKRLLMYVLHRFCNSIIKKWGKYFFTLWKYLAEAMHQKKVVLPRKEGNGNSLVEIEQGSLIFNTIYCLIGYTFTKEHTFIKVLPFLSN